MTLGQGAVTCVIPALIEGRIIAAPEARLIDEKLLAHAPSKIVAVMSKGGRLSGEIGFLDGAWQEGNPRPVTFSISRLAPPGPQLLFERTLDPKVNPADRGPQKFSVDIGPDGSGQRLDLLFETRPETDWGGTYWSQLQLGD